jgi:AcrR family transcriptional regulator
MDGRPPLLHGERVAEAVRERARLSDEDWIEAAIEALLDEGPSGLRIARLARRLRVTPGSFYWHFRDRDELRDRVLQHWRDQMLRRAAAATQLTGRGAEQLRALPQILVSRRLPQLDAAMRAWAHEDAVVADAVASADELRVRVVAAMFKEAGLDDQRARERARILWWAFLGSRGADESERLRAFRALSEALLHDAE